MKCTKMYGHALNVQCRGELIVVSHGSPNAYYCLNCLRVMLMCDKCEVEYRRMINAHTLVCPKCEERVVLFHEGKTEPVRS